MKYLLSTGKVTTDITDYIVDVFKLYLKVYPGDIPGASGLGFDFVLTNTMKSELPTVVSQRINDLVARIGNRFGSGIAIEVSSIKIIDEELVKVVLEVDRVRSEEITFKLYED